MENIILNEDLGNLKYIKKELRVDITAYRGRNVKLNAGFGRDSIIKKDIPIKRPIDVEKFVFDEPDIIASVIRINGEQSAIIAQNPSYARYDKNSLIFGDYKDPKGKKDARISIANGNYQATYKDEKSISSFKKWLKDIMKRELSDGTIETNKVSVDLIYVDKKRAQKRIDRLNQKIGAIAMMNPNEIRKKIRSELQKKLDKLKVSKVDIEANSIEELEKILNKYFPKSIKMKGYVYNLGTVYNFDHAISEIKDGKNSSKAKLFYEISRSEEKRKEAEYDSLVDDIYQITDKDEMKGEMVKLREKIPGSSFSIDMVVDKNFKFTVKEITMPRH